MELRDVIENLVKKLVVKPDEVKVTQNQGQETVVFEIQVAKEDMGRLIGRKGKTIEALRTIIFAFGVKHKKRCILQLIEDDDDGPGADSED